MQYDHSTLRPPCFLQAVLFFTMERNMDIELLLKLNELRDKGILTEEEFELKKKELLNFHFSP